MKNKDFFKGIKVVGFDFDDTVVDGQYSVKKRWQKVLKSYNFLSPVIEKRFFDIYARKGPSYKFHLDDTLNELKIDKKFKEEILLKLRETFKDEKLLDGVKDLLRLMKQKGLLLGIITDGKESYQENRIRRAGIYDFFDFIFYGNAKKEKKPTSETLEKLKKYFKKISVKFPEEFLYIGNNFSNDIEGFLDLGVKTFWVTNEKKLIKIANLITIKSLKDLWKKAF